MDISIAKAQLEANSIPEPNSGCYIWLGGTGNNYGVIKHQKVIYKAHRLAWAAVNRPIPVGLNICHRCDNPACVNPDHLFLGTQKDNMKDCIKKNRRRYGAKAPHIRKKYHLHATNALTWVSGRIKSSL